MNHTTVDTHTKRTADMRLPKSIQMVSRNENKPNVLATQHTCSLEDPRTRPKPRVAFLMRAAGANQNLQGNDHLQERSTVAVANTDKIAYQKGVSIACHTMLDECNCV